MYLEYVVLAVIILGITVYWEVKRFREKGISVIGALIGCIAAMAILSFSLYEGYGIPTRIVYSILYAVQVLYVAQDFTMVSSMIDSNGIPFGHVYIVLIYFLFFLIPALGATAIISYFLNAVSLWRFRYSSKKEYHIFSEMNDKTLALSEKILKTNNDAKVIFTNKDRKDVTASKRKILYLKEKINDIDFTKINKEKYVYFMSDDDEANLNDSLELLNKLTAKDNMKIYVLSSKQEAYMIIDSVVSQKYSEIESEKQEPALQVEVINETERSVLQRLTELPVEKIFKSDKKEVTVLLVGLGEFGKTFLKNIAWCFQVTGYTLKIVAVEKNKDVFSKLRVESPVLMENYDVIPIEESFETVINSDLLNNYDIDYAVVAAGTDENSFNIAVELRRYFWRNNKEDAQIDVLIRNGYRSKNIDMLKNEKNKDYKLNTFGSIESNEWAESIINSDIDKMAKIVHHIQNEKGESTDEEENNWDPYFIDYHKYEYNRKSSRATAVHIKYKLFSILKEKYLGDNMSQNLAEYEKLIGDEKIQKVLACNEHDRWMAYMYGDGYRTATIKDVESYYEKVGNDHKNTLAKLHPALVSNEDLEKAQNEVNDFIEKVTGVKGRKNFVESDYKIVQRLVEICNI